MPVGDREDFECPDILGELINKPVGHQLMWPESLLCPNSANQLTGLGKVRKPSRVSLLNRIFMQVFKLKSRNCTKPAGTLRVFLFKPYCQMWRLGRFCALSHSLLCVFLNHLYDINSLLLFLFAQTSSVLWCAELWWSKNKQRPWHQATRAKG